MGVASIGLPRVPLLGLNQDHLFAAVLRQQLQQPIVETTHFDHGDVAPGLNALVLQLVQELPHTLRFGAHLAPQHGLSSLVTQTNRQLSGMLVDSKIKHGYGPPRITNLWRAAVRLRRLRLLSRRTAL